MLSCGSGKVHCTSVLAGPNFSPGQNAFAESSPASRFRRSGGSGGSVEREPERKRMEIEREANRRERTRQRTKCGPVEYFNGC